MSRREVAKQKTVAHNHVLVLQAMARQANPDTIANQWLDHNANKAPSADDRQAAQAWTAANITLNSGPLSTAFDQMYGAGWAFGSADGQEKLGGQFDADFWDHWQPGNEAAAALVDPPKGLQTLLEQAQITMKDVDAYTLDRIGAQLASGLAQGFGADKMSQAVYQVLRDPARSMVIARTETARALIQANVAEYKDAGVEKVQWLVADPDDDCLENANVIVSYGDEFPSGDIEPPVHPNCMCDLGPVSEYSPALDLGVSADTMKDDSDREREDNGRYAPGGGSSKPSWGGATPKQYQIKDMTEQAQNLTEDDRATVDDYVNNGGFASLNASLRDVELTENQIAMLGGEITNETLRSEETRGWAANEQQALNDAIGKSVTMGSVTVYRGVDAEAVADLKAGAVLTDQGFMSTTFDPNVATEFGSNVLKIEVPANYPALYVDAVPGVGLGQSELLFQSGQTLTVSSTRMVDGVKIINAKIS